LLCRRRLGLHVCFWASCDDVATSPAARFMVLSRVLIGDAPVPGSGRGLTRGYRGSVRNLRRAMLADFPVRFTWPGLSGAGA